MRTFCVVILHCYFVFSEMLFRTLRSPQVSLKCWFYELCSCIPLAFLRIRILSKTLCTWCFTFRPGNLWQIASSQTAIVSCQNHCPVPSLLIMLHYFNLVPSLTPSLPIICPPLTPFIPLDTFRRPQYWVKHFLGAHFAASSVRGLPDYILNWACVLSNSLYYMISC